MPCGPYSAALCMTRQLSLSCRTVEMTALAASPDDLPRWRGHYKGLRTSRNHALGGRGRNVALISCPKVIAAIGERPENGSGVPLEHFVHSGI